MSAAAHIENSGTVASRHDVLSRVHTQRYHEVLDHPALGADNSLPLFLAHETVQAQRGKLSLPRLSLAGLGKVFSLVQEEPASPLLELSTAVEIFDEAAAAAERQWLNERLTRVVVTEAAVFYNGLPAITSRNVETWKTGQDEAGNAVWLPDFSITPQLKDGQPVPCDPRDQVVVLPNPFADARPPEGITKLAQRIQELEQHLQVLDLVQPTVPFTASDLEAMSLPPQLPLPQVGNSAIALA